MDREMADMAGRQHGVVSRAQLTRLGMSRSAIDRRIRAGRLHALHPGVFAVGHPIVSREGRWLAAVIRAGEGAVLSHRSAAELWGVCQTRGRGRIDVSTARTARSSATIHRHQVISPPSESTTRRGIPVTTLARTLFDLAASFSLGAFEAAIREGEYLHRFRLEELEQLLVTHPGRRGAATIKACLHRLGKGPGGRTRRGLEVRFAAWLAEADLPMPTMNALLDLDGFKVEADCLWRNQRLIVELDGGTAHGTRSAFESDRERDRRLQVAGWRVVRVTWRQLDTPATLLEDLRQLLEAEPARRVE